MILQRYLDVLYGRPLRRLCVDQLYLSTLTKAERAEFEAITKEISKIDHLYAAAPTPALYKERLQLQSKLS